MAEQLYNFTKQVNVAQLQDELEASEIIVTAVKNIQATSTSVDIIFKATLATAEEDELNSLITAHVYIEPAAEEIGIKFDSEGKILMHQTLRPTGFGTYFTGAGDDLTDVTNYGEGTCLTVHHHIGDPLSGEIEVGFNTIENETWIYEGYLNWQGAECDCISLMVKALAPQLQFNNTGNYDLYDGKYIVPSIPGSGLIDITGDITDPYGGLIEMPKNVDGKRPPGLWAADWNTDTKKFENITFTPDGSGKYNMFPQDVILDRFVNHYTINGMGTQELDSEDSKQIGHGMRIVLRYQMYGTLFDNEADHDWACAVNFTMHRQYTI